MYHAFDRVFYASEHSTLKSLSVPDNKLVRPATAIEQWPTHAIMDFWFGNVALLYWMDEEELVELVFAEYKMCDTNGEYGNGGEDEGGDEVASDTSTVLGSRNDRRSYRTRSKGGSQDNGIDIGRVVAWFHKSAAHHREHSASIARASEWVKTVQM
ncbi:hypothetical protein VKT23_006865 [Stygiomarasmius scandens]|uniref:Uncharacterized protein n=1 Tax=Marasmiellus scandens TaxID=2682957 RepID=A0ABR1JNX4_9AGAR